MIEISNILEVKDHIHDLKAVVFDLDDTLYSEKEYVRSGYRKIADAFPVIENAEKKLWNLFTAGKPAIDELLKQENMLNDETKQECIRIYRYQIPDIHFYAGVLEMIREFRHAGLKLGIITDGRPEGQRAKIDVLGLENLVDYIIVTDELGGVEYRKPNSRAFIKMKEQLNVEYSEMCYVGDNIKKDFTAPKELGMRCIHFLNEDGLYR